MRKGTKSEYDKTKPCKAISHEWEKERRVNMTKLNHANPRVMNEKRNEEWIWQN